VLVVGAVLAVIGLSSVPDDIKKWGDFFAALDSQTGRWLLVIAGVARLTVNLWWPPAKGTSRCLRRVRNDGDAADAQVPEQLPAPAGSSFRARVQDRRCPASRHFQRHRTRFQVNSQAMRVQ
jgi:hypothetical protein